MLKKREKSGNIVSAETNDVIFIKGARTNNLKNISVKLSHNQLIMISWWFINFVLSHKDSTNVRLFVPINQASKHTFNDTLTIFLHKNIPGERTYANRDDLRTQNSEKDTIENYLRVDTIHI